MVKGSQTTSPTWKDMEWMVCLWSLEPNLVNTHLGNLRRKHLPMLTQLRHWSFLNPRSWRLKSRVFHHPRSCQKLQAPRHFTGQAKDRRRRRMSNTRLLKWKRTRWWRRTKLRRLRGLKRFLHPSNLLHLRFQLPNVRLYRLLRRGS